MTTGPLRIEPDEPSDPARIAPVDRPDAQGHSRRRWVRWLLPFAVVAVAILIFQALVATREVPEKIIPEIPSPLVRFTIAEPQALRLTVVARGTVLPRTESDLVAEVRGRVVEVSSSLVVGAVFDEGDVLLRLDDREHRIALDRTRASVRLRESEARLAEADAGRRRELANRGAASAADLELFESRALVSRAALQEARAARAQAELDLERTVVRAPFAGRVRERSVDVGQFVSPGEKLGRIFAIDYAEVRLPIQTDDLAYLDGALDFSGAQTGIEGAPVVLSARLGGREQTWAARIERAEAAIDVRTRMLNLVARVDDPYGLAVKVESEEVVEAEEAVSSDARDPAPSASPPLPSGLFVTADIGGRLLEDVFVLPLMALRDGDRVFVLDEDEKLRLRDVSVVRRDQTRVVIDDGIREGERIVISPLRIYSEGMVLRGLEVASP